MDRRDGINEKGLCVSILRVDIKKGDQPATYPVGASRILRYMLDDCANVADAVNGQRRFRCFLI